ncbi:periplasmic binding s and sugar binding domain of LacI family protein, partial [Vibrio parahaemolyticus VPTS-2010_2]
ATHGHGL